MQIWLTFYFVYTALPTYLGIQDSLKFSVPKTMVQSFFYTKTFFIDNFGID